MSKEMGFIEKRVRYYANGDRKYQWIVGMIDPDNGEVIEDTKVVSTHRTFTSMSDSRKHSGILLGDGLRNGDFARDEDIVRFEECFDHKACLFKPDNHYEPRKV